MAKFNPEEFYKKMERLVQIENYKPSEREIEYGDSSGRTNEYNSILDSMGLLSVNDLLEYHKFMLSKTISKKGHNCELKKLEDQYKINLDAKNKQIDTLNSKIEELKLRSSDNAKSYIMSVLGN